MLVNVRPPDPFNMASSGKKGKKPKGKTLALNDFLLEGQAATIPIRKPASNWADEVEDVYENYDARPKTNVVLPTAPKAARGLDDYTDKIPQNPPYMAYLSNLPYDVEEDEIAEFFGNLKILSMRIPKGDRLGEGQKLKGYGYVEFCDREGLIGALSITDCTLKNRRIRIEVSNSENDRKKGGRMDMGRDRGDRPEVSMGDWRSGPRSDPVESERRQGGGGGGGFSRERERDAPQAQERPGAWRDGPSFRDDKFNRDERENRFNRDGDRRGFDRDGDRRGFNRDPDRRGGFTSRQDDRNGGFYRGGGGRDDAPSEKSESRQRPKLYLMPRTRPVEDSSDSIPEKENEPVRPIPASVPAASIFGSAKPVDTSARERQIEERLAKEHVKTDAPRDDRRRDDDRKRDGDRSPRRGSLERRKFSPRRGSPERRRRTPDRRPSPERRRGSPIRRHGSPERRQGSPERRRGSPERRWPSPDRRGLSPDRRRSSPDRRRSPENRRSPPIQRKDWRGSSDRVKSPDLRKSSPDRRNSPIQETISQDRKKMSPDRKKRSPEGRKLSSDRNKPSEHKKTSPERTRATARRNDGDKKGGKNEKPAKEKERQRREHPEMPKLKEPEAPNFVVSNVYAYLQTDSD